MTNTLTLFPAIPFKIKLNFNRKFFFATAVSFVIFLLVFYVFQVNSFAKDTYLLKTYQNKIGQLLEQGGNLEVDFSQTGSLSNVEKYLLLLNQDFEKTKRVSYIQILEDQVVRK